MPAISTCLFVYVSLGTDFNTKTSFTSKHYLISVIVHNCLHINAEVQVTLGTSNKGKHHRLFTRSHVI